MGFLLASKEKGSGWLFIEANFLLLLLFLLGLNHQIPQQLTKHAGRDKHTKKYDLELRPYICKVKNTMFFTLKKGRNSTIFVTTPANISPSIFSGYELWRCG